MRARREQEMQRMAQEGAGGEIESTEWSCVERSFCGTGCAGSLSLRSGGVCSGGSMDGFGASMGMGISLGLAAEGSGPG